MLNEPTIHQLEKLLAAFRAQGGTDSEINSLAQDIIRDFRPEKQRPASEVFDSLQHPSIQSITDFKKDPKSPIKEALSKFWGHWYTKYPIIFVSVFLVIFMGSNLPLYFTKLQPIKSVPKEIVTTKVLVQSQMEKSAPLEPGEVVPATPTLVVPKLGVTAPILLSIPITKQLLRII